VLVFLHGGGFRQGAPGPLGFVGGAVLARGALFVSMGYRLATDARYPESCDDVELGLRWLSEHLAERSGDPGRMYLSGHSAGATLAAAVGLRYWHSQPALAHDLIKGLALFSGPYDRSSAGPETDDQAHPRFVARLADAIERLPAQAIVVCGDRDMAFAAPDAQALAAAISARGGSVESFVEPDADHFVAMKGLASADGAVFQAVAKMMGIE
jgi:acetyl esterase/lipase